MSSRKVLYLDHTAVLSGGEVAMHNLVSALDSHKWHSVVVVGQDGPLVDRLENDGIKVVVLPMPAVLTEIRQGQIDPWAISNPIRSAAAIVYARRLADYIKR